MIRLLSIALFLALSLPAMAAGWTVERVRGEAAIEVRGGWQPVQVGLVIGNGSKLRTGASGRVDIARAMTASRWEPIRVCRCRTPVQS